MIHLVALVLACFSFLHGGHPCIGLSPPVNASMTESFAPSGRYAGHWGIDFWAEAGTRVAASASGWVSYAGVIAGNQTVTLDHGGGLKTSYSYLEAVWVGRGAYVERGTTVGTVGDLHGAGESGLHFSTRIDGMYVDPMRLLGCPIVELPDALRLVPVP